MPFLGLLLSKTGLITFGAALVAGIIFVQTARLNHAKADLASLRKANAEAAAHARVLEANAASISDTARKTLDQRKAQIIVHYKTLVERVPSVQKDDANCTISEAWRDIWNAGAAG